LELRALRDNPGGAYGFCLRAFCTASSFLSPSRIFIPSGLGVVVIGDGAAVAAIASVCPNSPAVARK
jgi:hypothetical protein